MGFWFSLIAMIGLCVGTWKIANRIFDQYNPEEETKEVLYTTELHQRIERIAKIDQELQIVTDMLINVDMGQTQNFNNKMTVSWEWELKDKSTRKECTQFPAWSGAVTQEKLRELASARRNELFALLSKEIAELPIRYGKNVEETTMYFESNIKPNVDNTLTNHR